MKINIEDIQINLPISLDDKKQPIKGVYYSSNY